MKKKKQGGRGNRECEGGKKTRGGRGETENVKKKHKGGCGGGEGSVRECEGEKTRGKGDRECEEKTQQGGQRM